MTKNTLRLSGAVSAIVAAGLTTMAAAQEADQPDTDDRIVVTASPIDKTADELLIGASVVGQEEIRERMSNTIGELLKSEPGVSSTFYGAGSSRPVIRGQGGDRVRILDNGIGSIDASSTSVDHAVSVDPAQAESVEIIRGSGLLRYGSSGAGGVVNIIDGRIPTEVPEGGIDIDTRAAVSSVDKGKELAIAGDLKAGEINDTAIVLHLDGALRTADDYDIPGYAESSLFRAMEEEEHEDEDHDEEEHDHEEEEEARDTLENSFVDTSSASAGISFINDKFNFGMAVKHTATEYGVPGGHSHGHGEEGHDHEDEDHDEEEHEEEEHDHEEEEEGGVTIDLDQIRYDLQGAYFLDSGFFEQIRGSLGIADYEHKEVEPSGEVGTVFSNQGYEGRLELVQRPNNGWRGASGIQYRYRDFEALGEEAFVPPTEMTQTGIFTFQDYEANGWHAEVAARYENTEYESDTGVDRSFDGFSVSAGSGFDLSETLGFGGTIFRTERAPTTEELFSNGPHLATDAFEIGDPDLDKEIAVGGEIIFRGRFEGVNFTLNGFYTDYNDYIYEAATGEEEDGLPVFAFTAADAVFQGFEAEVDAILGDFGGVTFTGDASLEYVDAKLDVDGNDNLPRIPPFGALVGLNADWDKLSLRAEVDYAAEQDETAEFELPTDSYTLVNAFVTYRPIQGNENVTVRLSANNLTDEEARQHTSFLKDQVPLPGRNFRISLEAGF